jgi:copper chaperone CopZ
MTLTPEGRTELDLAGGGCACCAVDVSNERAGDAASVTGLATDPVATTFGVAGMTCGSCVRHVTEELSAVDGVQAVEIALVAGGVSTVTVRSASPLESAAIADAVVEAGYEVVAP